MVRFLVKYSSSVHLPAVQMSPSPCAAFSLNFSVSCGIFWLLNHSEGLLGCIWGGTPLGAPGSRLAHWHILLSFPAPGCLPGRFRFLLNNQKISSCYYTNVPAVSMFFLNNCPHYLQPRECAEKEDGGRYL